MASAVFGKRGCWRPSLTCRPGGMRSALPSICSVARPRLPPPRGPDPTGMPICGSTYFDTHPQGDELLLYFCGIKSDFPTPDIASHQQKRPAPPRPELLPRLVVDIGIASPAPAISSTGPTNVQEEPRGLLWRRWSAAAGSVLPLGQAYPWSIMDDDPVDTKPTIEEACKPGCSKVRQSRGGMAGFCDGRGAAAVFFFARAIHQYAGLL